MIKNTAPTKVHLHKKSKILNIAFAHKSYQLPAEFLRVHSPSAEAQGYDQVVLVTGKMDVGIKELELSGNYGIRITFDDGHDTGIFTWNYLADLGENQKALWDTYLKKLEEENQSRDPHTQPLFFTPQSP